ncbi:FtsW/RodA/SpoVE family cell division protein [Listeria floridensis FSL S10-1187]|uniref:FtsW/RodA/SpoVE family cell division protein n=1 Tax=Listeria floridensis FSL S10-1187 TaxID=1265817 RepID=A0ABP3AXI5_9LIST|nr:FtsW/RodA/SpoVE family cell division protein [Listeria floridensis FSL S10-1187]
MDVLRKYFILGYVLFLLLLIGLQFTPEINGAKRWYRFPGLSFQPTEVLKGFFILTLASVAARFDKQPATLFFALLGAACPILLLVFSEPDLGTTILYFVTFFTILLIAMPSNKWIIGLTAFAVSISTLLFYILVYHFNWLERLGLREYQFARIFAWLNPGSNPNASYQVDLSLLAVGSGQLTGQTRDIYIPESHTDMIFSTMANRFGFIGVSILLFLFLFLIQVLIRLALELETSFSRYALSGFAIYFAFNIFQNIAMTIGVMPLTGIPLPFISYGGSSVLGNFIAIGLILAIIRHEKNQVYRDRFHDE